MSGALPPGLEPTAARLAGRHDPDYAADAIRVESKSPSISEKALMASHLPLLQRRLSAIRFSGAYLYVDKPPSSTSPSKCGL